MGKIGTNYIQRRLKYVTPNWVRKAFQNKDFGIYRYKIDYDSTQKTHTNFEKATHEIAVPFGKKVACDSGVINSSIENGDVFVFSTDKHIPTVYKLNSCSTDISIDGLHQWALAKPRNNCHEPYQKEEQKATLFRALPGGDPTEHWGAMDLNGLQVIPKGP